jgi:hypothetical protein
MEETDTHYILLSQRFYNNQALAFSLFFVDYEYFDKLIENPVIQVPDNIVLRMLVFPASRTGYFGFERYISACALGDRTRVPNSTSFMFMEAFGNVRN